MFLIYLGNDTYNEDTGLGTLSISTNDVFQTSKIRGEELLNLYPALFTAVTKNDSILNEGIKKVDIITITVAEMLTLNATPKELVVAPGLGKYIVVDRITASIDFVSTAYATNTTMEFSYGTATTKVTADIASLLTVVADTAQTVGGIEIELAPGINDNIEAKVAIGNPTAGDSDIKVTVEYRILSI